MPFNSPRPHLKPYRFKVKGDEPLSKKPFHIRLPKSLQEALDEIPPEKRNELVRRWIAEKYSEYQQTSEEENLKSA